MHYCYTVEDNRCWYLAAPSSSLASHPNSWCPLAAALPGNSEVAADVCAVMVTPFEDGAEGALRTFLAVGDGKDSGGVKIFAFKDQDGVRTPVDADQMVTFVKLMEAGRLRIAMPMGSQQEDMSMLMLMVPRAK